MTTRAAVYCRISDDREGKQLGVKRQEQDCRALAKRKGWTVAAVYTDNDISASAGKARPEYARLLGDIEGGAVDAVIVWHLSRLHRRPAELESFMTLADAKAIPLASVSGDVDLSTSQGRLVARLMGSVDAHESEVKGERIRRKHLELATQGRVSGGGTRPFGYEKDRITINEPEAAYIREAVTAVLRGESVRSIAMDWAARGVRSPRGNEFGPNALRRLLRSGRIAGVREHHGELVGQAVWPAIVPSAQAARVRAILGDPRRLTARSNRRYLLGGFLVCGRCNALLKSRPYSARAGRLRVAAYICKMGPGAKGCGRLGVVADALEDLIAEQVFYLADTPALEKAIRGRHRASDERIYEAITADETQLLELADDFANRRVSRQEWLRVRDTVQVRLDAARGRVARQNGSQAVDAYVGKAGKLRAAWGTMTLDDRRAILAALIDKIVIAPAKRKGGAADSKGRRVFDAERVSVEWRV